MTKDDIIDATGTLAKMALSFSFGVMLGLVAIITWSGKEISKRYVR